VDLLRLRTMRSFAALRDGSHHSEDHVGHSGIESTCEELLRGLSGATLQVVDYRQNPVGDPLDSEPPEPGRDVALTLDLELCAHLDALAALRDPHGAAMLVADCRTGEILGWSSYPAAPPSVFRDPAEVQRIQGLRRAHFYDRPASYPMEPGSIFKTVVALAALEEGVIDASERIPCHGAYDEARLDSLRCPNHAPHLDLDLEEALMRSCNVYFYRVGGDRLGIGKVGEWAARVGFWQPVGGIPAEALGVPPRGSPHSVAIGDSFTTTPIACLRFVCMLANRGRDPGLTLLAGVPGRPLPPIEAHESTWRHIIAGLDAAVHDPRGTAEDASFGLAPFDCAAKTGTAGIPGAKLPPGPDGEPRELNRAWLIGFAPVDEPQLAFVIALERVEGHGGAECAPIAARILEWFEAERGLPLRRGEIR
jgi:penicillin-binding protein 2